MDLGRLVLDKTILDAQGRDAGKVDDLLLDLAVETDVTGGAGAEKRATTEGPEVLAILSGPMALASQWGPVAPLARLMYRLLGIRTPRPATVAWSHVATIGVVVRLDIDREAAGLDVVKEAARRRISWIPGA